MNARAPGRHICSDVMSNLPVSVLALPVCEFEFEFECWLRSAHSIKGCKSPACAPVQCALLLLFISGESKITRPNNKPSHTLETWTVKHELSYTNLFNNFFIFWRWVHGVFFIALLMQWVHEELFLVLYKDTTTFVGMREWLEAKREICWRMHWSGFKWRFLLSACVQQQKKMKTVTIISYGLSDRKDSLGIPSGVCIENVNAWQYNGVCF